MDRFQPETSTPSKPKGKALTLVKKANKELRAKLETYIPAGDYGCIHCLTTLVLNYVPSGDAPPVSHCGFSNPTSSICDQCTDRKSVCDRPNAMLERDFSELMACISLAVEHVWDEDEGELTFSADDRLDIAKALKAYINEFVKSERDYRTHYKLTGSKTARKELVYNARKQVLAARHPMPARAYTDPELRKAWERLSLPALEFCDPGYAHLTLARRRYVTEFMAVIKRNYTKESVKETQEQLENLVRV
ncbi:hypothetical protein B0T16DRAFT_451000 [Cercophora newfieldiana]|uniref:Uncharacterized protein n=1 Tax=Cercophora newfieldiana TaxID=92897 RepID=A0AA39YMJ3_9PEZI|nr:hypothetical protein B0T16DRAFT_451000 [Cercophora newfieldiana]